MTYIPRKKNWHKKCYGDYENEPYNFGKCSMRIAIPIWDDRISPVLDTALRLLIVEIENQKEASRFIYPIHEQNLTRRCLNIKDLDVEIIICCAISHPFLRMLMASGINVIREISGLTEDVLTAYLEGRLMNSRFVMPWCKRNRYGNCNETKGRKGLKKAAKEKMELL